MNSETSEKPVSKPKKPFHKKKPNPNMKPNKTPNHNQNPSSKNNQNAGPYGNQRKKENRNTNDNFNRKEIVPKTRYKDPVNVLGTLSESFEGELVNEENTAPHLVLVDPRDPESKVSVVYFAGDGHFRVYDNYAAKVGDNQEVFYFAKFRDVSDFLESSMEDESGCYESYVRPKT